MIGRILRWYRQRAALRDYRRRHPDGLDWMPVAASPHPRYDAMGAQVGGRLLVFGGYLWIDRVHDHVDILDLISGRWTAAVPQAHGMPQSHVAMATDGRRYVYLVSGQRGPNCSPSVPDSYRFDAETMRWSPLPPLPQPRYAATMQLWRGRLHVVGGALADRYTAATEHWSLGLEETAWREEAPLPVGALHVASAVVDDRLFVFGGQQGDFMAIPGDPECRCTAATKETYLSSAYVFSDGGWRRLPDLPLAASHTETSTVVVGTEVWILGGQIRKSEDTFEVDLTDEIQGFDTRTERWSRKGRLPYRVKTVIAAYHDGWLYATAGQRDRGADCAVAGEVTSCSWKVRIAP